MARAIKCVSCGWTGTMVHLWRKWFATPDTDVVCCSTDPDQRAT